MADTVGLLQDVDGGFVARRREELGGARVFGLNLLSQDTAVVTGHAPLDELFQHEVKRGVKGAWPPSVVAALGADSLANLSDDEHARGRRIFAPAFAPAALRSYAPRVEAIIRRYIEDWRARGRGGEEVVMVPELKQLTLEVAYDALLGSGGLPARRKQLLMHEFEVFAGGLFSPLAVEVPFSPFAAAMEARRTIQAEMASVVRERRLRDATIKTPGADSDILAFLLKAQREENGQISDQAVYDNALLTLFAGHETTAAGASALLTLALQHRAWSELVREEWRDAGKPLAWEELDALPVLDAFVKETLRLVPPVGGGFRTATRDLEVDGFLVPDGWSVQYSIASTHADASEYEDPTRFAPERFLEASPREEVSALPRARCPFGFGRGDPMPSGPEPVTFGGGLRRCPGADLALLELKLLLELFLDELPEARVPLDQDLTIVRSPATPQPKDGLRLRFSDLP